MSSVTDLTDLREVVDVFIGVDTHVETHSAAVVDARTGGVIDEITVEATAEGFLKLVEFAGEHAALRAWAIEGTGSFGAGLTRHLSDQDELVIELDRPVRAKRRNGAKSDPLDAVRAAREALSRTHLGGPRSGGDHPAERHALAMLLTVRRSAVDAASDAQRQLFSLVIAAPEQIRERFRGLKANAMPATARTLRVRSGYDIESRTTVNALRSLARRIEDLTTEAATHEKAILAIVRSWRADLLDAKGVGPIVAATVLCAWGHPGRVRSEAAFAMLAGTAPIPANSGQVTTRYRLNRRGDRQLNRALHVIALSRCRYDQTTRDYVERRTREGKTPREIKRCLNATSHETSTGSSKQPPPRLDEP